MVRSTAASVSASSGREQSSPRIPPAPVSESLFTVKVIDRAGDPLRASRIMPARRSIGKLHAGSTSSMSALPFDCAACSPLARRGSNPTRCENRPFGGSPMAVATQTKTRFEVVPLSRHIGAEVRGIDLREASDEATIRAIYQTWLDHLVLVFPDQDLSQEDFVRVTGYFGEIAPQGRPPKYFPKGYARFLPGIMLISNIRE